MKKQNRKHQNVRFIDERLKTKSLCFIFFSCDLRYFKFYYVNCKEFGTSFLYWVDFINFHIIFRHLATHVQCRDGHVAHRRPHHARHHPGLRLCPSWKWQGKYYFLLFWKILVFSVKSIPVWNLRSTGHLIIKK